MPRPRPPRPRPQLQSQPKSQPRNPPFQNSKRQKLRPSKPDPHSSLTTSPPHPPFHPSPHPKPTISFLPTDHILLVGEGDFSFAYSLYKHFAFTSLVATSLDSRQVVLEKYPHAGAWLGVLEGGSNAGGDDKGEEGEEEGEDREEDEDGGEEEEDREEDTTELNKNKKKEVRVIFGVDATKLTRGKVLGRKKKKKQHYNKKGGGGALEPQTGAGEKGFSKIIFNFPHVGGKTKDVNRQVRYNQDLLIKFFTTSLPLLLPGGTIHVTLFESEPYQLWNIRDLARHLGLRVGMSARFEPRAYPGYRHSRTLGVIGRGRVGGGGMGGKGEGIRGGMGAKEGGIEEVNGKEGGIGEVRGKVEGIGPPIPSPIPPTPDPTLSPFPPTPDPILSEEEEEEENEEEIEGERRGGGGAWKGEEREARMFCFEVGDNKNVGRKKMKKKGGGKRKRGSQEDEDEDEDG